MLRRALTWVALTRSRGAGALSEIAGHKVQKMHFGSWLTADTYYGEWMTELIQRCRGVHEPQEEAVFNEVLGWLPVRPVMVEFGGYWCYYSIWLGFRYPDAIQLIVEPITKRREVGLKNLAINNNRAEILRAAIGAEQKMLKQFRTGNEIEYDMPMVTLDQIALDRDLERIDVLHADIQGFELQMLFGAERMIAAHRVSWIFISTHRWLEDARNLDLHTACLKFLTDRNYSIIAEHTPEESYSTDGLIVAKAIGVEGPGQISLSKRPETSS